MFLAERSDDTTIFTDLAYLLTDWINHLPLLNKKHITLVDLMPASSAEVFIKLCN